MLPGLVDLIATAGLATSLIRVIRGQASSGNQIHEARQHPASEPLSLPPTGPAGGAHATLEPPALISAGTPYMNRRPVTPETGERASRSSGTFSLAHTTDDDHQRVVRSHVYRVVPGGPRMEQAKPNN